jgi:hypothetical protein
MGSSWCGGDRGRRAKLALGRPDGGAGNRRTGKGRALLSASSFARLYRFLFIDSSESAGIIVVSVCKVEFTFGEIRNGKPLNFNVDTKGKLVPLEEDFEGIREAAGAAVKRRKEDVCIDCGLQ